MIETRRIGLLVIAIASVAIFFLMKPAPPEEGSLNLSATNYQSLIDLAISDYEANDALTDSAPQQQVVNGWVARDLLQIQTRQLADLLDALTQEDDSGQIVATADPRVPALLALAVLALSLIGFTSEDWSRHRAMDSDTAKAEAEAATA
jgi:hypothetical protein